MKEEKLKNIPNPGQEYHFFDDGKTSLSRHYICRCEKLITIKEAKRIVFTLLIDESKTETISLYKLWKSNIEDAPWLFAEKTDYFVEISCPQYDDNKLYAVRTTDGGWFTLDIQSGWQGGRIDVSGNIFQNIVQYWQDENDFEMVNAYLNTRY